MRENYISIIGPDVSFQLLYESTARLQPINKSSSLGTRLQNKPDKTILTNVDSSAVSWEEARISATTYTLILL